MATGTACLGKYPVARARPGAGLPGRGRPAGRPRARRRAWPGIAAWSWRQVEIHVITAPTLRLDREPHRTRLLETAQRLRPRLLLLDPLVRLHGIDENNASEVAGLLAYFRSLQRQLDLSVILVHHTRKNAPAGSPPVRDSVAPATCTPSATPTSTSDAPGNACCSPASIAPRAAPPPVYLELVATTPDTTHLEVVGELEDQNRRSLEQQVLELLTGRCGAYPREASRHALGQKRAAGRRAAVT